ncbi:hypothetical protein RBE51_20280 [Pseudomonas taiwanensis]|uniref:hypothetical protein n=1 Tax=Pseudomonas taiwanensis TaxID=470150 RepID=UPI0028DDD7B7|nr:hypothetical protein [Pseudomonas taiwanensis]MDT8925132.1 hypothetical protein [Pseudomonas taiwanensis]
MKGKIWVIGISLGLSSIVSAHAAETQCPAGKEVACQEATFQAQAYNEALRSKARPALDLDSAVAEGEFFTLKIHVDVDRASIDTQNSAKMTHMASLFSKPLQAMCQSPLRDKLTGAGGGYRTEVYAKDSQLILSIPLECERPGNVSAKIHPAS